jgi:hypothetical protein
VYVGWEVLFKDWDCVVFKFTVARRIKDICDDVENLLIFRLRLCDAFLLELAEIIYIVNTAVLFATILINLFEKACFYSTIFFFLQSSMTNENVLNAGINLQNYAEQAAKNYWCVRRWCQSNGRNSGWHCNSNLKCSTTLHQQCSEYCTARTGQ